MRALSGGGETDMTEETDGKAAWRSTAARVLGRLGGLKGGPARAKSMTAAQRSAQASKASAAAAIARTRAARKRRRERAREDADS